MGNMHSTGREMRDWNGAKLAGAKAGSKADRSDDFDNLRMDRSDLVAYIVTEGQQY